MWREVGGNGGLIGNTEPIGGGGGGVAAAMLTANNKTGGGVQGAGWREEGGRVQEESKLLNYLMRNYDREI